MSFWSENPPSEAEFISCTLGSLLSSDLRDLEDLDILPREALDNAEDEKQAMEELVPAGAAGSMNLPWFDSMMQGSKLGKVTRSKGRERREDGLQVEWEIVEWTDDGGETVTVHSGKRKLGEAEGPDSVMDGLH